MGLVRVFLGDWSQREQTLALSRLFVALVSLTALCLNTFWRRSYGAAGPVLLLYVVYSLLIVVAVVGPNLRYPIRMRGVPAALLLLTRGFWNRRLAVSSLMLIHIWDLLWATLICLFTGGFNSPFFFLFVFVLMAAAYRWEARGTLATTGAIMLILIFEALLVNSPAIPVFHVAGDALRWGTSLNRAATLMVLAGLMSFLARGKLRLSGAARKPLLDHPSSEVRVWDKRTAIERRRIAHDLHDGVIQSLISLEIELELLRRQRPNISFEAMEMLASVQGAIRQEVGKLRELTEELCSDSLPCPLPSHLAETVEKFRRETGIAVSLCCDAQSALLPPRVAQEVAGIVREGLANIRKHSGAQHVEVHLAAAQDQYQVVVWDDGRGFDFSGRVSQQQLKNTGKGPRVIQERVNSIGGELAIESYPNRGARLEVRFDTRK